MHKNFSDFNYLFIVAMFIATLALYHEHMITEHETDFILIVLVFSSIGLGQNN